ncbi:hypothetical protein PV334_02810 [Streptomyces sp. ME02-7008A-1]|uniref:hypothetical protein n=1 Tax=Streptomyces TaxID=1883 RepID=UPI0029BB676E|nr:MULTISPECIES: hypothetical protein [unclassified Streptomyces]MDX3180199.1 hypothetical protein [Streptomyces sp. ME02-7008A-1]MDX3300940.1 hypothetical protein [Streptomyces sp. ME02-7008A]
MIVIRNQSTRKKKNAKSQDKQGKRRSGSHKVCKHCGHLLTNATTKRPKATGLGVRRTREGAWSATAEPLDAPQLIKGIAAAIPAVLAELGPDASPSTASGTLTGAVRTAVLAEFRTRAEFVGRLCEIDALLQAQPVPPTVADSMTEHLRHLRVRRVTDTTQRDLFVVTEGAGEHFEVLRPAYIDEATGKLVLSGQVRRMEAPANELDGTTNGDAP